MPGGMHHGLPLTMPMFDRDHCNRAKQAESVGQKKKNQLHALTYPNTAKKNKTPTRKSKTLVKW